MNATIPFYSNTKDNTHCFQAVIKMLAKHYWPHENYSWNQLDKITKKVKDLWTWPTAGLLWLQLKGLEIKIIEQFDYQRFTNIGEQYLLEYLGNEAGQEQIKYSNVDQEKKLITQALKKFNIQHRIPETDDIKELLKQGFLIVCNVNSKQLNKEEGYVGHFILVYEIDSSEITFHDPGLPGIRGRKVSLELFNKSWAYPKPHNKNIIAFRQT